MSDVTLHLFNIYQSLLRAAGSTADVSGKDTCQIHLSKILYFIRLFFLYLHYVHNVIYTYYFADSTLGICVFFFVFFSTRSKYFFVVIYFPQFVNNAYC